MCVISDTWEREKEKESDKQSYVYVPFYKQQSVARVKASLHKNEHAVCIYGGWSEYRSLTTVIIESKTCIR